MDESVFDQDITGDGIVSFGSRTSTFADSVSLTDIDQDVLQEFGGRAQSDIVAIGDSSMFVDSTGGGSDMSVSVVKEANAAVIGKAAKDLGFDSSSLDPLTGVMDFTVVIPDPKDYGQIVSLSWVLPESTTNPIYLKQDPKSGTYSHFSYDATTGEGARWDSSTSILTVYVRDNGQYDADPTPGIVRDPGSIADSTADETPPDAPLITSNISLTTDSAPTIEGTAESASTCLLYTSPSPRDRQKSRMPSSA